MPYETKATKKTPALIIYLLDMSYSMSASFGGERKIDVVSGILHQVAREMVRRATKGTQPSPRYRLAIYAYSDQVRDVLGGPRPITEVIRIGVPVIKEPSGRTNTAAAFAEAERLLIKERANLQGCPAPLVCHLTDGEYNEGDPLPVVERIQQMTFPDGAVLVENIFFSSGALRSPITDPYSWNGVSSRDDLITDTAQHLFDMSSQVPSSYQRLFAERGYVLKPGARMLFPGESREVVEMAFTMSGMTPIA